jgi:hypothetical protein
VRVLGALVLALALAGTAWAQQPAPGCQGVVALDATGDPQGSFYFGDQEVVDLTSAFFRTDRTEGGRLVTSANLQLARLDTVAPSGAQAINWTMHWRDGDVLRYASATVRSAGEPSFVFGRVEGSTYEAEGSTTGRLLPGENGIAQVDLPEAISAPGTRLRAPYAASQVVSDFLGSGFFEEVDLAPDDAQAGGKTYVVATCGTGGEAPVPEPGTPVTGPDSPSLEHAPPVVTLMTETAGARYISRRRRIFLRLRSTGPVRRLVGTMRRRGGRAVGMGRLKAMHGKGTLIVRLTRKVRRGRYTVSMRGIDAEDAPVRATGRVRLR